MAAQVNVTWEPEVYIGSRIEHESERATLRAIVRALQMEAKPSVVFANINLSGRQIDFIAAQDQLALLIETKGLVRPVRGKENGVWQVYLSSGRWKDIQNPYVQALGAKNALRDAMRSFVKDDVGYSSAALVFVPTIPAGSSPVAGDFKVSVIGLDKLESVLLLSQNGLWTLDQWRAFARHLHLIRVSTSEAAYDPSLLNAEQTLGRYTAAYEQMYGLMARACVSLTCSSEKGRVASEDVVQQIVSGDDVLLTGPSGCGKSYLAWQCGIGFIKEGGTAITISAKDYEGNLKILLDREAGLLSIRSGSELFSVARTLNRRTLLIVDGYNECRDTLRAGLTRSIAAIAARFQCSLLITSQVPLARSDLVSLREIQVPIPDKNVKLQVATQATSGKHPFAPEAEALLDSVTSCLEASLVGRAGLSITSQTSKYGLFDAFARMRMGASAGSGIRALSRIAGWLNDRLSFSFSVRELDRLAEKEQIDDGLLRQISSWNLLASRGDRISFSHELFLNAFVSESVVRRAEGNATYIAEALRSPRHAARKELIVGAIDDDDLLLHVLEQTADAEIVASCLAGACGAYSREWAERRIPGVISRMQEEADRVRFTIDDRGWWNLAIERDSLEAWSDLDRAFIDCLAGQLSRGRFLKELLAVSEVMDRQLEREFARLREEARSRKIGLRSPMFGAVYVMQHSTAPGISKISSRIRPGLLGADGTKAVSEQIERLMSGEGNPSLGQVHLLVALAKDGEGQRTLAASFINWVIRKHWKRAPYHLRLELVDAAGWCFNAEKAERDALIESLNSLVEMNDPAINGIIFDVLGRLGALEASERDHEQSVRDEIKELLAEVDNRNKFSAAAGVYVAQFDHPYSNAYWTVVHDLPDAERKALFMMAGRADDYVSMFTPLLIIDLATFNDPEVGEVLHRWISVPPSDNAFPQDAIETFVLAHIALGRLGCPLPSQVGDAETPSRNALRACGIALYWMNRLDLTEENRHSECKAAWTVLHRHELGVALACIWECARGRLAGTKELPGGMLIRNSMAHFFPNETAEVFRQALTRTEIQAGYFRHFSDYERTQALIFALDSLGEHGLRADLPLLRHLADDKQLGKTAIEAIKNISRRLESP